ncbi:MAG: hypothetical protein P0Y59_00405 [Candidatus Sphingomonas phytovorans]|nr:hypothetical protein [Sphingomonas sp.]WEK00197.1 MAG: hypothetical protein P0Y59_00405 [Sphingomonas sp.]
MLENWEALFTQAQRDGDIAADLDIGLVAFVSRTQLYGLARMFTDGDFHRAELKADPLGAMKRAYSHHIGQMRARLTRRACRYHLRRQGRARDNSPCPWLAASILLTV